MYKLQFTLKQHTPLIHFQHEQAGATLRATEVKPKLDRFIIERLGGIVAARSVHPEWFISDKHDALNYKMRVENKGQRDETQKFNLYEDVQELDLNKRYKMKENYPMVLANMTGQPSINNLKDSIIFEKLHCTITSFNISLKDYISGLLVEFFAVTNFGNRNNKGFGSYTISRLEGQEIGWNEGVLPSLTHYLSMETSENRKIMEIIDYFYKWLKSGINYSYYQNACHPGRYEKSLLYQYLASSTVAIPSNFSWEKRWLKESFLGLTPLAPSNNPKFARGILGLSDIFTFTEAKCHRAGIDAPAMQNAHRFKKEVHKAHLGGEIERIKSPITFKPIKVDNMTYVYLLIDDKHIDEIYSSGLAKEFLFSEKMSFQKKYTVGGTDYVLNYKLGQSLDVFDEHITRLTGQTDDVLRTNLKEIQTFKNSVKVLPLPNAKIDLNLLFQFIQTNHPTFVARSFNWNPIINPSITISHT